MWRCPPHPCWQYNLPIGIIFEHQVGRTPRQCSDAPRVGSITYLSALSLSTKLGGLPVSVAMPPTRVGSITYLSALSLNYRLAGLLVSVAMPPPRVGSITYLSALSLNTRLGGRPVSVAMPLRVGSITYLSTLSLNTRLGGHPVSVAMPPPPCWQHNLPVGIIFEHQVGRTPRQCGDAAPPRVDSITYLSALSLSTRFDGLPVSVAMSPWWQYNLPVGIIFQHQVWRTPRQCSDPPVLAV